MSHSATSWAYKQHVNSSGAKFVLVALADFADEAWSCYPGQERIAKMTGQSVSSVGRHMKWLEDQGYLTRQRRTGNGGHRTSDRYVLSGADIPTRQSDNKADCQQVDSPTRNSEPPTRQIDPSLPVNLPEEPSVEPLEEPSDKEGRAKRATRIKSEWMPKQSSVDTIKAECPNVDLDMEHRKFIDHYLGNGRPMKDWDATWRNWMRKARPSFSRPGQPAQGGISRADAKVQNWLDIGARLTNQHAQTSIAGRVDKA